MGFNGVLLDPRSGNHGISLDPRSGKSRYLARSPQWESLVSCWIPADTLLDILTVEEMLMYTAELKRPMQQSRQVKKEAVEELIDRLALAPCRNVRIGR